MDAQALDKTVRHFRKKPWRTLVLWLVVLILIALGIYVKAFLQEKGKRLADLSPAQSLKAPNTSQPAGAPLAEREELVRVLERRAERVVQYLDQEQQKAITAIDNSVMEGRPGVLDNPGPRRTELVQRLAAIRAAFLQLHRQHVEAIRNDNLILAHELVSDIHYLLWIENRDIFYGTRTNPTVAYSVGFPPPDIYAALYSGSREVEHDEPFLPTSLSRDAKGTGPSEPDPVRLKRIEELIVALSKIRERS